MGCLGPFSGDLSVDGDKKLSSVVFSGASKRRPARASAASWSRSEEPVARVIAEQLGPAVILAHRHQFAPVGGRNRLLTIIWLCADGTCARECEPRGSKRLASPAPRTRLVCAQERGC